MWKGTKNTLGLIAASTLVITLQFYPLVHAASAMYQPGRQHTTTNQQPQTPGSLVQKPGPEKPPRPGSMVANPMPADNDGDSTLPPSGKPQSKPGGEQKPGRPKPESPKRPGNNTSPDSKPVVAEPPQPERRPDSSDTNKTVAPAPRPLPDFGARVRAMKKRLLDAPRVSFSVRSPIAPQSAGTGVELDHEASEILVSVGSVADARRFQNRVAADGYRVKSRQVFRALDMVLMRMRTPDGVSSIEAVFALRGAHPEVEIELNHRYGSLDLSETTSYAAGLVGWREPVQRCGAGPAIGMIDTAVNTNHSALSSATVEHHSVIASGMEPAPSDHGSGVAAILVGDKNIQPHFGLANSEKLIAVNAFYVLDSGKAVTNTNMVVSALDRLVERDVQVINMSFGGPESRILAQAVNAVVSRGAKIIAAAGNIAEEDGVYPAAYPDVIAVTAVDARSRPIRNGAKGGYIDFSAPGVDIWSPSEVGGGKYLSGSSLATPFVAALVLGYVASNPNASTSVIYKRIRETSTDLGSPGHDPRFGWGLISWPETCEDQVEKK